MSGPGGGGGGRMKSSPKQGPLKATIPISSVTKEGSNLRKSTSPTMSSAKFGQVMIDMGRNSPNTTLFDEKQCNIGSTIRRTASLDTIYLRGLFPKDAFYWHRDRSTQTEISNSLDSLQTTNSDANEKFSRLSVRARRRSVSRDTPNNDNNTGTQTNLVPSTHHNNNNKLNAPKSSRSSEEGLNQEIEGIILRSESDPQCSDRLRQPTPEGRKAPVADLLKFKISTNTQTLVGSLVNSEESQGSSPDQDRMNASPRINKFLEREPPDGCERVPLKKSIPIIIKPIPLQRLPPQQPQQTINFTLKPSSGSAFETLIINKSEEGDLENVSPKVPAAATAQEDLN